MSIEITPVRFRSLPKNHESISEHKWASLSDGSTGSITKAAIVDWIDNKSGIAYVGSGAQWVNAGTADPASGAAYLRTYADSQSTNNLLSLPEFQSARWWHR